MPDDLAQTPAPGPPLPVEIIRYEEKIRARLAGGIVFAFVAVVAMWTWKAPQLPGDVVGLVTGAFATALGGIVQAYWSDRKK